jgi:polyferredoxin
MNTQALKDFIDSPYNKVADIKMLLFFVDITAFAFGTILLLMVASLFISNFWCRYFCSYGGLLGLISFFSPVKIRRVSCTCTDCLACTRVCPAMITVHKAGRVNSDECTGCLECVRVCPVDNTLYPEIGIIRKKISPRSFVLVVMGIFLIFYLGARLTGHWNNNVSRQEYIYHVRHIDEYTHLR